MPEGEEARVPPRSRRSRRPRPPAKSRTPRARPCASSVGASRPRRSTCWSRGSATPAAEYAETRHNVGFMVADELARRHGRLLAREVLRRPRRRSPGRRPPGAAEAPDLHERVGPLGRRRAPLLQGGPSRLLVVHDEVDLEPGRLQARLGGGLAGHNGLRSIAQQSAPPTSPVSASAWGVLSAAIRARWPTSCSRRSTGARRRGARVACRRCGRDDRRGRGRGGAAEIQRARV